MIVLKMCNASLISGILNLEREDLLSRVVTALTLLFMRMALFATNAQKCPAKLRIQLLWASLCWFTSLRGIHLTPMTNFVFCIIGAMYNAARRDIANLRYTTEEVTMMLMHALLSSATPEQ